MNKKQLKKQLDEYLQMKDVYLTEIELETIINITNNIKLKEQ